MDIAVSRKVLVYSDQESLSRAVAESLTTLALATIDERGRFALALSGGSTPCILYQLLAGEYRDQIPWPEVHLFWGDERCVPPEHRDSNFGMARQTLIAKVPVPPENIHRIPVEIKPYERAAKAYEQVLREFFGPPVTEGLAPSFDLVLLGVGEDGHTASLFSGSPVLQEQERWVAAVQAPPTVSPAWRVTLTLPIINRAARAFFLISGEEKRAVVTSILGDHEAASQHYPAAMVRPKTEVIWFLDQAAAAK